jgi:site-specific DNA-methyltransferase (adenine-specific)
MTVETFLNGRVTLHKGDCLDVLKTLEANSVDSVVCDPPYHLTSIVARASGMSADKAETDSHVRRAAERKEAYGRMIGGFMGKQWDGGDIAFRPDVWRECLRVLKSGGYLLAFASTRGFGRMSVAIEDAGFITHPLIAWVFGSGFPKATRIKAEGFDDFRYGGQALKPAIEPIYMGQKPFEKGLTGTQNIVKWGTGALNIGGCRVDAGDGYQENAVTQGINTARTSYAPAVDRRTFAPSQSGRWPANLIHDGSEEVLTGFPETASGGAPTAGDRNGLAYGEFGARSLTNHGANDGSAARFFYSAKAGATDRIGSKHPTVKPVDLMAYLVRLVTPPKGVVLDPFSGTGTTGEAAYREGMSSVLIEREPEYQADIAERMRLVLSGPDEKAREIVKRKGMTQDAGPLFGGDPETMRGGAG